MNITVYCASSLGHDPDFAQETRKLGAWIGAHRHTLVYGGTNVGLMGLLSDVVLDAGGRVVGVLPDILADREPPSGRVRRVAGRTGDARGALRDHVAR